MAMKNQINALQNQLALANQALVNLSAQIQTTGLKSERTSKFKESNARAWLYSLKIFLLFRMETCRKNKNPIRY